MNTKIRLSAREAAQISDEGEFDRTIDKIFLMILEAAKEGKRSISITSFGIGNIRYRTDYKNLPQNVKDIDLYLQQYGYTCKIIFSKKDYNYDEFKTILKVSW